MGDTITFLQELKDLIARFVRERDWEQFHTPKNLAMSIAIEAAELMEIFQWAPEKTAMTPEDLGKVREELADVVIYCLAMANRLDVDLSSAVQEKVAKNSRKYPKEKYCGRYK